MTGRIPFFVGRPGSLVFALDVWRVGDDRCVRFGQNRFDEVLVFGRVQVGDTRLKAVGIEGLLHAPSVEKRIAYSDAYPKVRSVSQLGHTADTQCGHQQAEPRDRDGVRVQVNTGHLRERSFGEPDWVRGWFLLLPAGE